MQVKLIVELECDDSLRMESSYILSRIESKINKVLGEYSKEVFNASFAIKPVVVKQMKEKETENATVR